MATELMGSPVVLPDGEVVYRGLSCSNWADKLGNITYRAFRLRPATPAFPPERELSVGRSPKSSVDELKEHHGAARLDVAAVHALPHGLRVVEDRDNPVKAQILGMPLHGTEQAQVDLIMTVASDLASIAKFSAVP